MPKLIMKTTYPVHAAYVWPEVTKEQKEVIDHLLVGYQPIGCQDVGGNKPMIGQTPAKQVMRILAQPIEGCNVRHLTVKANGSWLVVDAEKGKANGRGVQQPVYTARR